MNVLVVFCTCKLGLYSEMLALTENRCHTITATVSATGIEYESKRNTYLLWAYERIRDRYLQVFSKIQNAFASET